jgi:drug/metabolite transporter (DMT)-like permease
LSPLLWANGGWMRSKRPAIQATRALAVVASALLFILGLGALPIAEATALVFASPLFVTLLSVIVLRERVDRVRWLVVGVGFAGVLIVMRPGSAAFQPAALLPVASSMAWAVAVIFTRKSTASDGIATTMLHSAAIGLAVLSLLVVPGFVVPTPGEAVIAALMAVAWCAAQWLTVGAYHRSDASLLAPFSYSQVLWAGLLGFAVFGHVPDAPALAGMAVILSCGALAALWAVRRVRSAAG